MTALNKTANQINSFLDGTPDEETRENLKENLGINNLVQNQMTGVQVYDTFAGLPATGVTNTSYKVSNDSTATNNGYYHWDGSQYVKDSTSALGEIASGNADALPGGKAYDVAFADFKQWLKGYDSTLVATGLVRNGDAVPSVVLNAAYRVIEDGTAFGYTVSKGDLLTCRDVSNGYSIETIFNNTLLKANILESLMNQDFVTLTVTGYTYIDVNTYLSLGQILVQGVDYLVVVETKCPSYSLRFWDGSHYQYIGGTQKNSSFITMTADNPHNQLNLGSGANGYDFVIKIRKVINSRISSLESRATATEADTLALYSLSDSALKKFLATQNRNYTLGGRADTTTALPTSVKGAVWFPTELGTVLGLEITDLKKQVLVGTGNSTTRFVLKEIEENNWERIVKGSNLFDKTDLVYEYYYHTGSFNTASTTSASNFIRVKPGQVYTFRQTQNRHAIYGFTDRDNNAGYGFVGERYTFGTYAFTMPETVNFVKIGWIGGDESYDEALLDNIALIEGDVLASTPIETFVGEKNAISKVNGRLIKASSGSLHDVMIRKSASINLLDYSRVIFGWRINDAYTGLWPDGQSSTSHLMECKKNTKYVLAGIGDWYQRRVLYYDKNGVVLSGGVIANDTEDFVTFPGSDTTTESGSYMHVKFTSPDNADIAAMRVTIDRSMPTFPDRTLTAMVYEGDTWKPFTPFVETYEIDGKTLYGSESKTVELMSKHRHKPSVFTDKTLLFIGDSLTSNGRWISRILNLLRPKAFYNRSAGGARLVNVNGTVDPLNYTNCGVDFAHKFAADYVAGTVTAPDYIFICLGTNELNKTPSTWVATEPEIDAAFTNDGSSLIDLSTVDITTIPGALRYIVQTLYEVFPDVTFFIWTPIPNVSNPWSEQRKVADTIKWTARRMSIPIIDMQAESNIVTLFDYPADNANVRNIIDGTHPFGGTQAVSESPAIGKMAEYAASKFFEYVQKNQQYKLGFDS